MPQRISMPGNLGLQAESKKYVQILVPACILAGKTSSNTLSRLSMMIFRDTNHLASVLLFSAALLTGILPLLGGEPAVPEPRQIHFNVPKSAAAPSLQGKIEEAEWEGALTIRGLSCADIPAYAEGQLRRWVITDPPRNFDDRRVTFRVMWDENHLYLAGRSAIPEGTRLTRDQRAVRPTAPLIHDDAYEFAVESPGSPRDVLMCIVSPHGVEQCRKLPPDYRPYARMPASSPDLDVATKIWEDADGRRWWDVQIGFDLEDLGAPRPFKAGDQVRLSLARIFQFPWRYSSVPTSSTYMDGAGFPVATLVDGQPRAQIDACRGLNKGRLTLRGRVLNPAPEPQTVRIEARTRHESEDAEAGLTLAERLDLPPGEAQAFEIDRELQPAATRIDFAIECPGEDGTPPVYEYSLPIGPAAGGRFLDFRPPRPAFPVDYVRFDRKEERLLLQSDALPAGIEEHGRVEALAWAVRAGGSEHGPVLEGRTTQHRDFAFQAELDLSDLPPGHYEVTGSLLDDQDEVLLKRSLKGFDKTEDRHGTRYLWWREVETDAAALAEHDPLRDLGGVAAKVNEWYRQGRAAGNVRDYYHNHDHLHSYLDLRKFPQVTPIDATDAARSLVGAGLQHRKLFTGRVVGNASMVARGVSLPEFAYRHPRYVQALYRQYTNNHLYLYPSHRTGPNDYTAYTPYVIASRGSSGSEQRIMEALFATLAAFPPETKDRLTQHGLIAPALQMLLRRHYSDVSSDENYLSARAHPVIFNGEKVGIEGMVEAAQRMRADRVPLVVRLEILEEDFEPGQKLFTTPGAVARTVPDGGGPHTMALSAAASFDANDRDLRLRWVMLRGDPERTRIKLTRQSPQRAKLTFAQQTGRTDIAVFAHNGACWSAPAIVSCDRR